MNKVGEFLSKPHPFNFRGGSAIASGLIIAFLLFLLRPFGFSVLETIPRLWKSILLGGVTSICLIVTYAIMPRFFPSAFSTDRWTIGKDFAFSFFNILVIGFFNSLVINVLDLSTAPFDVLVVVVMKNTLYIGIVASLLLLFYEQSTFLKAELEQLQKINEGLLERTENQGAAKTITFMSEVDKPEFRILADEIIYLKAEGNYVEIFCNSNKKELLRNRIKAVSGILPQEIFFQCHRSFIVNASKVAKVKRGHRNYELELSGTDHLVPVSRSKNQELIAHLKQI